MKTILTSNICIKLVIFVSQEYIVPYLNKIVLVLIIKLNIPKLHKAIIPGTLLKKGKGNYSTQLTIICPH